jgi:hypothetical protein
MYAVFRRYENAKVLTEEMLQRQDEIRTLLRAVRGFSAYYAIRSGDVLVAVTVCENQAGTQETTRLAAEWVRQNLPAAAGAPPAVTEGEVIFSA